MAKKKARRRTPVAAAATTQGPVTLEEARALAAARSPRRALRRAARRTTDTGPTPESVGEVRGQLEEKRREERERRKRDYAATLKIMKRRGARPPAAEATGAKRRAKKARRAQVTTAPPTASFEPLQVFAEGDSWFDYPVPFFGGGIIPRLEHRLGVPILNLAEAGDEVRFMLGVEQRERIVECLTEGCPAGGPWDAMLFSGGGNDIVDNPMALWVRDFEPGKQTGDLIHQPRFTAALALVRAGYEDLIRLRDDISAGTHLIFHAYDFALPDGRGICHLGPWLKPTFTLRRFPGLAEGAAVVRAMLEQFAAMLATLTAHPKVTFINGQGTLEPKTSSWHNELHPSQSGFKRFTEIFYAHLKQLFPDRVA